MSTWPTITCQVAFAADSSVDPTAGQWIDVSDYLRSFSTKRGRNRDLDQIEAGRATFVFRNADRRFDPENTAGPYYPNVRPLNHVRVRATYNSITYDLWRGYVDGWPQKWPGRPIANQGEAIVEVTATDAFKLFANAELPATVWEFEVRADSPTAWWRHSETDGSATMVDNMGAYHGSYSGALSFGQDGLVEGESDSAISGFSSTSFGQVDGLNLGTSWTVVVIAKTIDIGTAGERILFRSRSVSDFFTFDGIRILQRGLVDTDDLQATFKTTSDAASTIGIAVPAYDAPLFIALVRESGVQLRFFVQNALFTASSNSGASTAATPSGILRIGQDTDADNPWPDTIDEVVVYNDDLATSRVVDLWEAATIGWAGDSTGTVITRLLDWYAWPAALRSIATGKSTLQSTALGGTLLSFLQKVTSSEVGVLFVDGAGIVQFKDRHTPYKSPGNVSQATFGDDTAELPYQDLELEHDDAFIYNEARVGREGASPIVVKDATSIAKYQTRTFDKTDLLLSSDLQVVDYANWIVSRRKDPKTEVRSMTIRPESRATLWVQALSREIGDLVTVKRRPPGGGAVISKQVRIEGIEHSVTNDRKWTTTYWLSGWTASQDQPWILGDPVYGVLGSTTRLGF